MELRAATHRSGALLLLAAVLAAASSSACGIGDKCAACKAVAVSSLCSSVLLSFFEQSCLKPFYISEGEKLAPTCSYSAGKIIAWIF